MTIDKGSLCGKGAYDLCININRQYIDLSGKFQ